MQGTVHRNSGSMTRKALRRDGATNFSALGPLRVIMGKFLQKRDPLVTRGLAVLSSTIMNASQHFKPVSRYLITILILISCLATIGFARASSKKEGESQITTRSTRRTTPPQKSAPDMGSIEALLTEFRRLFAQGCYESAFINLNNVAAEYYDHSKFPAAMQAYQIFANFADPITTVDPSDSQEEAIRKSTVIKDMSRNYVRFMFNTQLVHPELCRTNNCVELAWEMMEKVKSRLLRIDLINSGFSRLDASQKEEVRKLIARIRAERLARSQLRLATGKLLGPTEKDGLIASLEAELARYLPEYTNLAGEPASLQRVRELLTDNEILLSFVYTNNERKVYLFRVEKNGPLDPTRVVVKTDLLTEELFNSIENIKRAIVNGRSLTEISSRSRESLGLQGIYDGLLRKLDLPPNRRLIIATDQNLSALPFDLLPWKNGQRMMDAFEISYVPSATVFYNLRKKRSGLTREPNAPFAVDYAGFGYRGEEGDSLIHTETEIENAARHFTIAPTKPNAAEADIYRRASEIQNAKYLHFATHNYSRKGIDASFYLAFGNGENNDGHLTSHEIITRLRNRADLAVLSSCETAQANDNYQGQAVTRVDPQSEQCLAGILTSCVCSYGESFSNLSGAFFAAGSKQLLLTQWKISDDSLTDIFISRFFALLSEHRSPAEALKETKQKMSAERPLLWAGFILAGD
jgi:CHAT domain-containing protein